MLIQCTKKLLDQLKIKPNTPPDEHPLFSWHANLITMDRRKTVVLTNDQNRYVIVLHGLKAKDFSKMDEPILDALRQTFRAEGIKEEVIEKYIDASPPFTFTKTKNRTLVSRLNKACEYVPFLDDHIDPQSIVQPAVSMKASRYLSGNIWPNREMYQDLEKFSGGRIFDSHAVQIKVTLQLENHPVYRRLIIPLGFTFSQLHETLQIAFGWQDAHLHEFYILGNETKQTIPLTQPTHHLEREKPIVNIVCDEEALSYESKTPMKLEHGLKLTEYLPQYKSLRYIYDFGDHWLHEIEMEDHINDYDKNYPECLEGEGNTPPEDVGGKYGYEMFLEVMDDKNHPDHEEMVSWSRMQRYRDFDLEMVNNYLRSHFY